jgi:hypothetical protein
MEMQPYEHHDYIVLMFDNSHDFLYACNALEIKRVNASVVEKKKIGLGRVVNGINAIKKLQNAKDNPEPGKA